MLEKASKIIESNHLSNTVHHQITFPSITSSQVGWKAPLEASTQPSEAQGGQEFSNMSRKGVNGFKAGGYTVSLGALFEHLTTSESVFFLLLIIIPCVQLVPVASHPVTGPLQEHSSPVFSITSHKIETHSHEFLPPNLLLGGPG